MSNRVRACGLPSGLSMRMRLLGDLERASPSAMKPMVPLIVFAQDGLGGVEVSGNHVGDGLAKELAAEGRVGELFPDGFSEAPCEGHLFLDVFPHFDHGLNGNAYVTATKASFRLR